MSDAPSKPLTTAERERRAEASIDDLTRSQIDSGVDPARARKRAIETARRYDRQSGAR